MITIIDVRKVHDAATQELLLRLYREAIGDERFQMSLLEAAWYYGYAHNSLRKYASEGVLETTGAARNRRVTHAQMRAYQAKRRPTGRPLGTAKEVKLMRA